MIQDRFKFRVWNKDDNKMIDWKSIYNANSFLNLGCQGIFIDELDRHIFMQCIERKDKNDKLIFEGDIVKTSRGIGKIEWMSDNCSFVLKLIEPHKYHYFEYFEIDDGEFEDVEVIGNIYENIELLIV